MMVVPEERAEAEVMTTRETPELMASKAFWSFGIMPSEMVPSATIIAKSELVMVGMTLERSFKSFITPGVDEQYVRVTS